MLQYTAVIREVVFKRVQIQATSRKDAIAVLDGLIYEDELGGSVEGYGTRDVMFVALKDEMFPDDDVPF